jgi:mRNA interferase RelE/StbE
LRSEEGTAYEVAFTKRAAKELRKLGHQARERIAPKIDALAEDPRPHGCKKLSGEEDLWRIRVGDYRVLYQIRDDELLVLIVGVGHRSDIYR